MKQIKFFELADKIKGLSYDGDKTDLRLHYDAANYRWGAKNKRDYQKAEKEIDAIEYKGEGWTIYAWYDVSGFQYWMKTMEETNYIQITISFDNEDINEGEVNKIESALDDAIARAEALENKYNYNPCTYN